MRAPRHQDGFTLIELLIEIVVLGILTVIVVLAIGTTRGDAIRSTCATRVRSIRESAEAVRVATDAYPVGPVDVTTTPNPLVAPQAGALLKEWPTSSEYVLRYTGSGATSYTIAVYESDGSTSLGGCNAL